MINIGRINETEEYRYNFPTIDFKFQNTGNATAFLWQFGINILHVEVDLTPLLVFKAEVWGNELRITVTNNGWGTIHKCQFQVYEPTLNQLFPNSLNVNINVIASGSTKVLFSSENQPTDPTQFEQMKTKFVNYREYAWSSTTIRGTEVNEIEILWSCQDDKCVEYKGKQLASFFLALKGYFIPAICILTENGFIALHFSIHRAPYVSDITYISIIDPSKGIHEKQYPISRKIPPGDIERFHIMVGAKKSCHLRLRFRFYIDKHGFIESDEFKINIWNPRASLWLSDYRDGSELKREGPVYLADEYDDHSRKKIQRKLPNYPFLEKESTEEDCE